MPQEMTAQPDAAARPASAAPLPGPISPGPIFLGIDTGGTYTDAALWSEAGGPKGTVLAKAKALTTRHDLAVGISGAVDAVLEKAGVDPAAIKLVSMSTTLATNALVEGQGGRVALVMVGFAEDDLARDGLKSALGTDPVVFCPGGHNVHGDAADLDLSPLEAVLPELAESVSGFAVCGYFATRNPEHELAARDLIRARTGLPVTASHELSAKLGGPRRALTTLLNARLIAMIDRLVAATEGFLEAWNIHAPLMVVRGDGALVSAAFARQRPIETILSGPAASLVGARHMTGLDDALVSDIGGTTTDVAVLDKGRPRLDPEGATVGGYRTMVEAVAMRTFGLGGDSEVALQEGALDPRLVLGPRRLVPLSLAAAQHGRTVTDQLERQLRAPNAGRMDARFAFRTGIPERYAAGLGKSEARLYASLFGIPPDSLAPDWKSFVAANEAMMESDTLTVTSPARDIARHIFSGAATRVRPPKWYRALTAQMLPDRLRMEFELPFGEEEQRSLDRALNWMRRLYPLLPDRLRTVGPYQEALARLQGRDRPSLATRWLNQLWIGQPSIGRMGVEREISRRGERL